jgi:hypothetical protein
MGILRAKRTDELYDIIDRKVAALISEMEAADWPAEEVTLAIADVLQSKWIDRFANLRGARQAVPKDFLSDGNEG